VGCLFWKTYIYILQEEGSFPQQTGPKFKEETRKLCILTRNLCGAENWTLSENRSEIDVKIFKRVAGEGWRTLFGPIIREMKRY